MCCCLSYHITYPLVLLLVAVVIFQWWWCLCWCVQVTGILGPAEEGLQELLDQGKAGNFQLAFIDANKRAYQQYFDLCLKLVRPGGLIVVDNVLFYGKVADPEVQDKITVAIRQFNDALIKDERVSVSIIPVGDGMALCRVR
jgi:predicted O-methyltransferase YrrM